MRMRFFGSLHPAVSFLYFAAVLALTLVCFHPVMAALSLVGAVCFSAQLNGWAKRWLDQPLRSAYVSFYRHCKPNF